MQRLRLVILEHIRRGDRHRDLLIESPGTDHDRALLWAARTSAAWPPPDRPTRGLLLPLPPHRRVYLMRQGDIGRGRGRVVCLDAGEAAPHLWRRSCIDLRVATPRWRGRLRARRQGDRWLVCTRGAGDGTNDRTFKCEIP